MSRRPQDVRIAAAGLDLHLERGERIWTESSYKCQPALIDRMARAAGFRPDGQWIDAVAGFALTLLVVP